ncbi:MAG: VWA domain-containing protein [Actinomycetota bacterium]|nr:VWA domain-containing protein [Actinomycetota bacterium]
MSLQFDNFYDTVVEFSRLLRDVRVPVSMTELVDATLAIEAISPIDREQLRVALFSTMVKSESHRKVFNTVFDVFFSRRSNYFDSSESEDGANASSGDQMGFGDEVDLEGLREMVIEALRGGDPEQLARLVRIAVARYAGIERGRSVSGVYYSYRTLKQLNLDAIYAALRPDEALELNSVAKVIANDKVEDLVDSLKSTLEDEIRRILVEDRGATAVVKTIKPTLPQDLDFISASRDEIEKIRHAIGPLASKLRARISGRARRAKRSQLDFRKTFRESLRYGGVPIEMHLRKRRPSKPEIFVIADISGSVASFARFALQLVYALSENFSKVRAFVFIDAIDEVTDFFSQSTSIEEAIRLINTEANVVHLDGHTDYGNALEQFTSRYLDDLTKKSTILILGDARNNYHASKAELMAEMRRRSRGLYFLNPEPANYWNSGDSIVREYQKYADRVVECRNLRQLEVFVDSLT